MDRSPPPLAPDEVRFLPLGGLGEIGMNCFVLEQAQELLVVDCGASFPDDDLGADLVIPDFSWLCQNKKRIVGLFITHGHEDHIGAIPQLFRALRQSVAVYAPAHAAALIAERLGRAGILGESLFVVEPGQQYCVGSFLVEPIPVAHSIVGATALCIETRAGRVLHTADFNLDAEQPVGHLTDALRLTQLGDEGIRLLLSDSTNVQSLDRPYHEGDVGEELNAQVLSSEWRVVVGMFSSNAHRLGCLLSAARRTGRKVCLLGRSLNRHLDVCVRLGYIKVPSDLLIAKEQAEQVPRERLLVIAGGSQGEAASALRRLSLGDHPHLGLERGDRLLLSARIIPGNERAVLTMLNDFRRMGVQVITSKDNERIHTSGHASRSELEQMLIWTRPSSFVPVHGTLTHLQSHAALAEELGVADFCVVENGQWICFSAEGPLRLGARLALRTVRVAMGGELLSPETRRMRGDLGRSGVLLVSVSLSESNELVGVPVVTSLGIPGVDGDEGATQVLTNVVRRRVLAATGYRMLASMLRADLRSAVVQMCGVRPVVAVHLCRHGVDPAAPQH